MREIKRTGLIEIESHTLSHQHLNGLTKTEIEAEIKRAKEVLKSKLQIETKFFAYPYGEDNEIAKNVLQEKGFLGAATTKNGFYQCEAMPYELFRINVSGENNLNSYHL